MTTLDIVLPALATGIVVLLFYGPVRRSRSWHAMVTPLASIIGSGFLVVVPVLGHALGADSIWAILAIVVFAYGVGEALRFNIVHLEPLLASTPDDCRNAHDRAPVLPRIELLASLALALAYFVSVTFYLRLLSAFVLRGLGWHEAWTANALTTALLVLIGAVGKRRGLSALERLEQYSQVGKSATRVVFSSSRRKRTAGKRRASSPEPSSSCRGSKRRGISVRSTAPAGAYERCGPRNWCRRRSTWRS